MLFFGGPRSRSCRSTSSHMEVKLVQKSEVGTDFPFSRCDAEFVWKSLWDVEAGVRSRPGSRLADLVTEYNGPTLNESFAPEDSVVNYVDIDSIDTADGLAYAEELFYGDRPSRAK